MNEFGSVTGKNRFFQPQRWIGARTADELEAVKPINDYSKPCNAARVKYEAQGATKHEQWHFEYSKNPLGSRLDGYSQSSDAERQDKAEVLVLLGYSSVLLTYHVDQLEH